jgi:hypothetical protein
LLALSFLSVFTVFSAKPTAYVTASYEKPAATSGAGGEKVILSSYGLDQCRDELAVCMDSVDRLKVIVLDKCEKPHHDFELVAWEIANSHDYVEGQFSCNDFSQLLAKKLESIGYASKIVEGEYRGEPHVWVVVEIPIEATNGNLITPEQYAYYMEK